MRSCVFRDAKLRPHFDGRLSSKTCTVTWSFGSEYLATPVVSQYCYRGKSSSRRGHGVKIDVTFELYEDAM